MTDQKTEQKPEHEKRIRAKFAYSMFTGGKLACVDAADLCALLADLDAVRGIVLRQSVLLGEYSKSLDKDDPDYAELVEINGLIDAALKGATA